MEVIVGDFVLIAMGSAAFGWAIGHNMCWKRMAGDSEFAATVRANALKLHEQSRFLGGTFWPEYKAQVTISGKDYDLRLTRAEDRAFTDASA
jgi:hypothetical protein